MRFSKVMRRPARGSQNPHMLHDDILQMIFQKVGRNDDDGNNILLILLLSKNSCFVYQYKNRHVNRFAKQVHCQSPNALWVVSRVCRQFYMSALPFTFRVLKISKNTKSSVACLKYLVSRSGCHARRCVREVVVRNLDKGFSREMLVLLRNLLADLEYLTTFVYVLVS